MENPNFIVELFIRTLQIKHKLTFQKQKEEYFRVLFDTYLNGQGNADQLKDYISAGIDNPQTINIIAAEVIEWQAKAEELKAAEAAQKNQKEIQKQKIQEFVASRTKKLREEAEQEKKQRKQRKQKGEQIPKKKIKPNKEKPQPSSQTAQKPPQPQQQGQIPSQSSNDHPDNNIQQGQAQQYQPRSHQDSKSLKNELQSQGKQKCKFYPFCKNLESCQYFHPTQRCTYFPHCRYGDSCLYEHQACKFKEKCNKPNCGYAHPFKKTDPFQQMMKSLMSQHNPLHTGQKVFKKKPNPKFNKQEGNQEQK